MNNTRPTVQRTSKYPDTTVRFQIQFPGKTRSQFENWAITKTQGADAYVSVVSNVEYLKLFEEFVKLN